MKERPILFSSEMVRAILNGRKTQTRRVVKPQPKYRENAAVPGKFGTFLKSGWNLDHPIVKPEDYQNDCPYGIPGDRLWVRESFTPRYFDDGKVGYKADWTSGAAEYVSEPKWKPSIHMPRLLSRITLEITNVRVERVDDISENDAEAEGVGAWSSSGNSAKWKFQSLWDRINGKTYPYESNPWVWVIEFVKIRGEHNQKKRA